MRKSGLLLLIFILLVSQFGGLPVRAATEIEGDFKYEVNGDGSTVTITGYAIDASDASPKEVEIPATLVGKTVTVIGDLAFYLSNLLSVTIPDSVTTIGDRAFQSNQLSTVAIPDSVTTIGSDAFSYNKLADVTIGDSVETIGASAFAGNQLSTVTIPDSVTTIGTYAFADNQLSTVAIPSGVTTISGGAFANNQLLTVTIPGSVTTIGYSAFANNQLSTVTIPGSITTIGTSAFADNQLSTVAIPNSVTSIGHSAFRNNQLSTVNIPKSVTSIGERAFINNKLTEVTIYNDGMSIGEDAFLFETGDSKDVRLYGYGASTTEGYATGNDHLFTPIGNSVTYDGNNQTSGDVPIDKRTYGEDQEVTVLDNMGLLLKDGFTFSGWNTSAGGSGTNYPVESEYLMGEEDVTLYAKWTLQAAAPTVYYVKEDGDGNKDGSSWTNAYGSLQAALSVANTGDEIWIAAGTYYPTEKIDMSNPRTATFQMINGVTIYGGFAGDGSETVDSRNWKNNQTILSGDLGKDDDPNNIYMNLGDNAYHVFYHPNGTNLNNTAVLDGVSIVGGNANETAPHDYGGGMYNANSHPVLRNVTLSGNAAYMGGGGMYNMNSHPILTDVTISDNRVGGGSGGEGGGLYNDSSNPVLTNVVLRGNYAYFYGGGMFNKGSEPRLTNVTISGNGVNNPGNFGGGMYNENSDPIIDKSIIWGNKGTIQNVGSSEPTFKDSIIEGSGGSDGWNISFGVDEGGNLDDDPLFVDPKNFSDAPTLEGDYRLLSNSPAIMISEIMGALGVYESSGVPETKHTLIFEVDGVEFSSEEVVEDGTATQPTPPTKAEHTFVGWYKDVGTLEDEWNFTTDVVTEDITLYSKWTPFTYEDDPNDSSGVEITRYASTASRSVVIPSTLGGKEVTSIGDSAFYNNQLERVTIPASVTLIGNFAFHGNQLKEVMIPAGVTSIGDSAFSTNQLKDITIPVGVTSIGDETFAVNQLESVTIPVGVTSIGIAAFSYNQLESVTIPASMTSIGESAFHRNKLKEVMIPADVTSIGIAAFSHNQLERVTIPASVTLIDDYAFINNKLKEVTIPIGVTSIGVSVFKENELNKVVFEGAPTVVSEAFSSQLKGSDWYIDRDVTKPWDGTVPGPMTIYIDYNKYEVTFNTDGGTVVVSQEVSPGEKAVAPASNPTKAGHTFVGWYYADLTTKWDFDTELITADTTLYAKWKKNSSGGGGVIPTYTLTFESYGGSDIASQKLTYNEAATNPTVPTKEGYTFAGWYEEPDFTNEWNFGTGIVKNTILYAKWTPNSYTLTFDSNEGSTVDAQSIIHNETAVIPTPPTKAGYTFAGWFKEADLTNEWNFTSDVVTEHITLYAKWIIDTPIPIPSHTLSFETN